MRNSFINIPSTKKSSIWNDNELLEYMLVIDPGRKVNEQISVERQNFVSVYGEQVLSKTKSHIKIAHFQAKEVMEETLNRWIYNICNQHQSFELSLNNYSGFPPHSIYIRVQDHAPVNGLKMQLARLNDYITSSGCPPVEISAYPHVSIAGKLSIEVYDRAIKDYSQKDFHESFMVDELILFRRSHQFENCSVVNRFCLSKRY